MRKNNYTLRVTTFLRGGGGVKFVPLCPYSNLNIYKYLSNSDHGTVDTGDTSEAYIICIMYIILYQHLCVDSSFKQYSVSTY